VSSAVVSGKVSQQVDEAGMALRLTVAQYRALQATERGEVYRTHTSIAYTLTGPCGSVPLWALARADLIANPLEAGQRGRHDAHGKGPRRAGVGVINVRAERKAVTFEMAFSKTSCANGLLK
jgi:hypothetical protein